MTVRKPRGRSEKTRYPGVYRYHQRGCAWRNYKRCNCTPSYQGAVYSKRERKPVREHFDTLAAARTWREDSYQSLRAGKFVVPTTTTLAEALDAYISGMENGTILDRSGKPYKPSTCRSYKRAATLRLKPAIGHIRLTALLRSDVQDLVDDLRAEGRAPSTIHNTLDPLRATYRRAVRRDQVAIDPTDNLELPAVRGSRDRTVSPIEAETLINALPPGEQALWATAIYVGLRRGELQELRYTDLDLDQGVGRCERAWDDEGRCVVHTKTDAGDRLFPTVAPVRRRLIAHKLATGRGGDDLVFGRTATDRFVPSTVRNRARAAWKAAGLEPVTLHEGRHSAATAGSAAGLDDLALAHIIGHSSVVTTRDSYGHVRLDRIIEVRKLLDTYYNNATAS